MRNSCLSITTADITAVPVMEDVYGSIMESQLIILLLPVMLLLI